MKRVLFIAYHFPPLAGGGTFRSLKFVKYLPDFNWIPTVITTNTRNYWAYDTSLLDEIPDNVKIIRASEIDPFYLQVLLSKLGLSSLYRLIRDKLLVPDERVGWIPFAYLKAKKELKRNKYDLIFSTSPTPCAHIIAYLLKKKFNLPWVADYRDQWTNNPEYPYKKVSRKVENFNLEQKLNKSVNKIISVTKINHQKVISDFKINKSKLHLIYNGFDHEFVEVKHENKSEFTISYTGTFYGDRNPKTFLDAIKKLILEQPALKDIINIQFIGKSDFNIDKYCNLLNINSVVHWKSNIPRNEINNIYNKSSIFFLIIPNHSPNILTSKFFDYIQFKKPVLALIPDGEAKEILTKSNLGYFANPNSVEDIKNQILNLYNLWKENKLNPKPNSEYIKQFHRRNLTKQLAYIFNSLI